MNIERQIQASIKPVLDRCDALLDHYLQDAPREVWEPIMGQVAAAHYGNPPCPLIPGSFADVIERLDEDVRRLAQSIRHEAFYQDNALERQ